MHTYEYICICSCKMTLEIHRVIKDNIFYREPKCLFCGKEMSLIFYLNSPDVRSEWPE